MQGKKKQGLSRPCFSIPTPCLHRPDNSPLEMPASGAEKRQRLCFRMISRAWSTSSQDLDPSPISQRFTFEIAPQRLLRCGADTSPPAPNCHHDCDPSPQIYCKLTSKFVNTWQELRATLVRNWSKFCLVQRQSRLTPALEAKFSSVLTLKQGCLVAAASGRVGSGV